MSKRAAADVFWWATTVASIGIVLGAEGDPAIKVIAPAQAQTAARGSNAVAPAAQNAQSATTNGGGAVGQTIRAFQEQVAPPPPAEKPPVVEFASAVKPGEHPGPGELVRTIRTFVHWTLVCDALTGKRQVCFLEQRVVASDGTVLTWQVAQTAAGHVMMILKAPPNTSEAGGLKLFFAGFERTEKGLRCDTSACLSLLPFEGRVAEWMTSEPSVGFGFEANGRPYQFTMSMGGFKQAVDAIPRAARVEPVVRPAESERTKAKVRTAAHRPAKDTERVVPLAASAIKKDF